MTSSDAIKLAAAAKVEIKRTLRRSHETLKPLLTRKRD